MDVSVVPTHRVVNIATPIRLLLFQVRKQTINLSESDFTLRLFPEAADHDANVINCREN